MKRALAALAATLVAAGFATVLAASGSATTVQTRQAKVNGMTETILTTSQGMTLYYYDKDSAGTSQCTGRCAKLWPPYTLDSGQATGPSGIATGLKAFTGANGRQLEYHGHPLYTYAKDGSPGDVKGVGVFPTWHVATPQLQAAGAASQSAGGSGSGGSGSGSSSGSAGGYGYH